MPPYIVAYCIIVWCSQTGNIMKKPDTTSDPNYLPDNLPDCHKLITDLRNRLKSHDERIAELEKQLSRRNRALFGKKSAKLDSALLTGTGKAVHVQTANELDAEKDRLNIVPDKKYGGGRSAPSSSIETSKVEHRIDENQLPCPDCKQPREIIGFDVCHQIEFVRSIFEYIQHVMFKYACKNCEGQIITAQKPYQPIDKGLPGPGLLAKIATDKFWLHLPLYRQEQVFTALSIPINRSSMCRWLKGVADILAPIAKRMNQLILKSRVIQSDATTLPVIKKGLGKTHRGLSGSIVAILIIPTSFTITPIPNILFIRKKFLPATPASCKPMEVTSTMK